MSPRNKVLSPSAKTLSHSDKVFKYLKLICVCVVAVAIVYFAYGTIGSFVLLGRQPEFTLPDGGTTKSLGFMVQGLIYCGLLTSLTIAEVLMIYFMYVRKKKTGVLNGHDRLKNSFRKGEY